MPMSVAELQPVLHDLFNDTADHLGRETGFCQRARKLTGSVFAQSLVFSFLDNPQATLDDFAETAFDVADIIVTPQAFDKRFTPQAASFLRELLLDSFNRSFESLRPTVLPLLRRFPSVHIRDGSTITLPSGPLLGALFPGHSHKDAPPGLAAAVKLVWETEVSTGGFTEVSILAGVDNEKISHVAGKPLPEGTLLLEDMGFLCGERVQKYVDQGVIVLTRIPAWTAVFEDKRKGKRIDLVKELRKAQGWRYERQVRIFHKSKLSLRLLAIRLPEEEAEKRREQVRRDAKKRGRPVSQKKLDLCEWNILVTNATQEQLSAEDACVARRVRWQVELVFKVFKSEGKIDETRSECPHRVLCELYAKLLAMVVQQWLLLTAGYVMLKHSGRRAARRVRKRAIEVAKAMGSLRKLGQEVIRLATQLHRYCRIVRRKSEPSTLDRLNACDPHCPGFECDP